jgi:hypothetical protein
LTEEEAAEIIASIDRHMLLVGSLTGQQFLSHQRMHTCPACGHEAARTTEQALAVTR